MTIFYGLSDEMSDMLNEAGVDYDLHACLECNHVGFAAVDIEKVLAVHEGENDGNPWYWILKMRDGRFIALDGWCDYTGWDCQSGATASEHPSPVEAATSFEGEQDNLVYDVLMKQLESEKAETWREKQDVIMGLTADKDGDT